MGMVVRIFLVCLAWVAAAQAQQMYRWVDKDGRVTYSQNPPPAGAAKSVQPRSSSAGGAGGSASDLTNLPYAVQVAVKNFPVTFHTTPDCGPPCEEARAYLQKRGVPFKENSIVDGKGFEALKALTGGKSQVPVVQIGSRMLSGFEASAWKSNLDEVGYPASIPRPQQGSPAAKAAGPRNLPLVRLYTHPQCGQPCQDAKQFLTGRAVPFQETSAESPEAIEAIRKLSPAGTVPLLVIGDTVLDNFDAARYDSAIVAAGYPRLVTGR